MRLVLLAFLATATSVAYGQNCVGFIQGAEQHVTVTYKETNRRGKVMTDVKQAIVTWSPQDMLSDLACYDTTQAALLYKTTDENEYVTADIDQFPAGKKQKWTLDVKPCLAYNFAIKVRGEVEEATFELPAVLGPASQDEILNSKFVPDAPSGFDPEVLAQSAVLRWARSDCSEGYDVYYKETGSEEDDIYLNVEGEDSTEVQVNDLKSCTTYDVAITSYLGDEFGTLESNFATKPRLDAAKEMAVSVEPTMTQAEITMEVWQTPCIEDYEVEVCTVDGAQCNPRELIKKTSAQSVISYTASSLSPCTEYTIKIKPTYPGTEVEMREVTFKTLSPSADTASVGQVSTASVSSNSMMVTWPEVKCASNYRAYQKEADSGEWIQVGEIEGGQMELTVDNILPCTRYNFAVTAVLNGEETEKSVGEEVVSALNEEDPFEAPNLDIANGDNSVGLSWDHAICIESYTVRICQNGEASQCNDVLLEEGYEGRKTIDYTLQNLSPCTQYSLEIIPVIPGKTFTARTLDFTTTNGTPQAPLGFKVQLVGNTAEMSWERMQCATEYKVTIKAGNEEVITAKTTDLQVTQGDLQPCQIYYFSVSTLVVEQESEATDEQSLLVPPAAEVPPTMKILSNENDNVTLRLDPASPNERCSAQQYEVSYSSNGARPYQKRVFTPEDLSENGDLVVSFKDSGSPSMIVQGRLRYDGTDVWSEVASSREPGDWSKRTKASESQPLPLVPILVGALVLLVLLVLIVVFLVRKRRARDNYDAEKADNNGKQEETQKLNDNHPDA